MSLKSTQKPFWKNKCGQCFFWKKQDLTTKLSCKNYGKKKHSEACISFTKGGVNEVQGSKTGGGTRATKDSRPTYDRPKA